MTDVELRKIELEAEYKAKLLEQEVRLEEARAGVRKVIFGTMIVGIVAAMFPFLISVAELLTAERIERIKANAQISVVERENKLQRELANEQAELTRQADTHARLESLAQEGRAEDINKRIVLAQYYTHLALDQADRNRWQEFLKFLEGLRKREAEALALTRNTDLTAEQRTEAENDLASIREITRPQGAFPWSMDLIIDLQMELNESSRCGRKIAVDGGLGFETAKCLKQALGIPGPRILELLKYEEGRALMLGVLSGKNPRSDLPSMPLDDWTKVPDDDYIYRNDSALLRIR